MNKGKRYGVLYRVVSITVLTAFLCTFAVNTSLSSASDDFINREYLAAASQLGQLCREFGNNFHLSSDILTPTQIRDLSIEGGKLELPFRHFLLADSVYNTLSRQRDRIKLAGIFKEAIKYDRNKHKKPFPFKAWELFRVLYVLEKLNIPNGSKAIKSFLDALGRRGGKFVSYIDAFSYLGIDEHLNYAERLLKGSDKDVTNKELAQYHIGRVLRLLIDEYGNKACEQDKFKKAMLLLEGHKAVDNDKRGVPYPIGIFARDLVRRDTLIRYYEKGKLKDMTQKAVHIEQFKPFARGTEKKPGDSILFPPSRKKVTFRNKDGKTVSMTYEELREYGKRLSVKSAISVGTGGRGERYDKLIYDSTGKRIRKGRAKGVYRQPIDNAESFVANMVRQVTGDNYKFKQNIPVVIYTSIFTDVEIKLELRNLGYEEKEAHKPYSVYKHQNRYMPLVRIVYCSITNNVDSQTGDFVSHERLGIPVAEALWPDAHDSSFIDLIASGTAYKLIREGKEYAVISNVDNRAGVLDPVLLALADLTGKPLICEIAVKPTGQKGGTAVRVDEAMLEKYPRMKRIFKGNPVFILEGFEFSNELWESLDEIAVEEVKGENPNFEELSEPEQEQKIREKKDELIGKYFRFLNTANYVLNIREYVRQAFSIEEKDVDSFLKKFYDAKNNPDKLSRFRFELLESAYKFRMQSLEEEKRYKEEYEEGGDLRYAGVTAVRFANLASDQVRTVESLMIEVPAGEDAGINSRFEPQKEQLRNLIRLLRFYEYLRDTHKKGIKLKRIIDELTDVGKKKALKGPLFGNIVPDSAKKRGWDLKVEKDLLNQTLREIAETIRDGIEQMAIPSVIRIAMKPGRKYPKGNDDVEDVISSDLQNKLDTAIREGINNVSIERNRVYFLDTKWKARAEREYNGSISGQEDDLFGRDEYGGLLDWFESEDIYSITVGGDIKDIVIMFFDVIVKVIARDGLENLEDIINDLGIFNLYVTQDDIGKRLVITSPVELRIADAINGLVKQCYSGELAKLETEISSFIETKLESGQSYIGLNIDRLKESPALDYWKRKIEELSKYKNSRGLQLFQFFYFSEKRSNNYVRRFLKDNNLIGVSVPAGTERTRIITIVDPEDIKKKKDMSKNTMYLPMPYMKSSLYMAAEVVLSGGAVDSITPIVRQTIVTLYKEVLGRDVTEADLLNLFNSPWVYLPEIRRVIEDLETMRQAIQMTEMAA